MKLTAIIVSMCAALIAVAPAQAGTLASDTSSYLTIWHGSTHFAGPWLNSPLNTQRLEGDVEWAVYGPGQFPAGFTAYDSANAPFAVPADQFVYAYQVFVSGTPALSQLEVTLTSEAYNIGTFTGTANDGSAPVFSALFPYDSANWFFDGINPGGTSLGLFFTSPNVPMLADGRTIDHGSTAQVVPVPSPNPPNAPEPATVTLALIGAIGLGVAALRRRRLRK